MTSATEFKISDCLTQEIALMTKLNELLKNEQLALVDNEISALNQYTQEKSILVNQVNELERQRAQHLTGLGYANTLEGVQSFLEQADESTQRDWQTLLGLTAEARESNRANGLMINRRLLQSQAGLESLQQNNPTGNLYGPSGQSVINSALKGRGVKAG